ncbi:hypothetical protein AN2V17_40270 [Vallitalea sp. AN17-2]|uniref:Uncharacterized protein n=1 Tax=Vallitalea maricola TaxID=3074433 RepID=A0ACB5UP86_9FIRM|nr:hypothetical protein AN2V17_40270 [Vallitalea sp. AN17-2]
MCFRTKLIGVILVSISLGMLLISILPKGAVGVILSLTSLCIGIWLLKC